MEQSLVRQGRLIKILNVRFSWAVPVSLSYQSCRIIGDVRVGGQALCECELRVRMRRALPARAIPVNQEMH